MMRARCVGGPLHDEMVEREDQEWRIARSRPRGDIALLPFGRPLTGQASVEIVYHVYQYEMSPDREHTWKYLGERP